MRMGAIAHPFIGLTPELAKQFNADPNSLFTVPEVEGELVAQVVPNSPAAQGGLRRGRCHDGSRWHRHYSS